VCVSSFQIPNSGASSSLPHHFTSLHVALYTTPQGAQLVTQHSVRWAAATLLSRAFSIDLSDDECVEGGA
jgi:hypothetical protein